MYNLHKPDQANHCPGGRELNQQDQFGQFAWIESRRDQAET